MKVFTADSVAAQPAVGIPGVGLRWVIAKNVDAPNFAMRIIEVQPGAATEKHTHAWEHEVYVLQGQGTVCGADGVEPLAAGTCVYVAPNELHQFANAGTDVFRMICVIPNPK
jgi:quercetin dioxygenase-like cupin family protein